MLMCNFRRISLVKYIKNCFLILLGSSKEQTGDGNSVLRSGIRVDRRDQEQGRARLGLERRRICRTLHPGERVPVVLRDLQDDQG